MRVCVCASRRVLLVLQLESVSAEPFCNTAGMLTRNPGWCACFGSVIWFGGYGRQAGVGGALEGGGKFF